MYHSMEGLSMTYRRRFDFSLLTLVTLLVLQASIASYGLGIFHDVAQFTQSRLAAVAAAGRR